jgi:hypothetical protein
MSSTDDSSPVDLSIIDNKIETFRMTESTEKREDSVPAPVATGDRLLEPIKPEGFCE